MANRALNPGMIDKRSVRRQKLDRRQKLKEGQQQQAQPGRRGALPAPLLPALSLLLR